MSNIFHKDIDIQIIDIQMWVSINGGNPKSSMFIRFVHMNHQFLGVAPLIGKPIIINYSPLVAIIKYILTIY